MVGADVVDALLRASLEILQAEVDMLLDALSSSDTAGGDMPGLAEPGGIALRLVEPARAVLAGIVASVEAGPHGYATVHVTQRARARTSTAPLTSAERRADEVSSALRTNLRHGGSEALEGLRGAGFVALAAALPTLPVACEDLSVSCLRSVARGGHDDDDALLELARVAAVRRGSGPAVAALELACERLEAWVEEAATVGGEAWSTPRQ